MAVNNWDKSEYERQMSCVKKAADAYSEWIDTGLGNANVTRLMSWVERKNITSLLQEGLEAYRKNTVRLHDLKRTMKEYLEDYEAMIAGAKGDMENVEEVESTYGTFGTILSEIGVATGGAIATSKAYKFAESGKTFIGDYNDLTAFMNECKEYDIANFWHGVSKIGDMKLYGESIRSAVVGEYDPYVIELMQSSIKSMVEGIPNSEPISLENIDWVGIENKLGIEGLAQYMGPIADILVEWGKGGVKSVKDLKKKLGFAIAFLKMFGDKTKSIVSFLEDYEELAGDIEDSDELINYLATSLSNFMNGYADQIAYLETMKNSMLEMGYWEESPVMQQIDELRKLYDDAVIKTQKESMDLAKSTLDEALKKLAEQHIPVLKDVTKFWGIVGKSSAVFYDTERIKAASELMGCMQFDNVMMQTYEHYSNLVESGIASAEEIAEADRLYDMIKALKIKEYKSIQTISEGKDDQWYRIATKKLEELEALNTIQTKGSSGGWRSGGGRRG